MVKIYSKTPNHEQFCRKDRKNRVDSEICPCKVYVFLHGQIGHTAVVSITQNSFAEIQFTSDDIGVKEI